VIRVTQKFMKLLQWSRVGQPISRRGIGIGLLFCVLLALGIRGLELWMEPVISRDGLHYVELAEALQAANNNFEVLTAQEGGYAQSPLFVTILSARISGMNPHTIALVLNITLGSLFPLIIFLLLRQMRASPDAALAGAFLAALHPTLIDYSIEVQREMGYLFFSGMFFLFLFGELNGKNWKYAAGTAIFAVLAFFFRYEGWELPLFALIVYGILLFRQKSTPWQGIQRIGMFAAVGCLSTFLLLLAVQKSPVAWAENCIAKLHGQIRIKH